MYKIEVINILKRHSDKKTERERVIKSPAFLLGAAIWSHLSHSWIDLNYMCKTTTASFFKRIFFRFSFILLDCDIYLSKFKKP